MFDRVFKPPKCHSEKCVVCEYGKEGKFTKCRMTNVVYKAECLECLEKKSVKKDTSEKVETVIEYGGK